MVGRASDAASRFDRFPIDGALLSELYSCKDFEFRISRIGCVLQACLSRHSPVLCVPYTAESAGDEFRSDDFGLNAVASSIRHTSATAVSAAADRTENNPHITNFTPYPNNIYSSHRSKRWCKFLSNV